MNKFLVVVTTFIFSTTISFSQQFDSTLNIISSNFPQEKIFIHFDKYIYKPGETIWLKAYLTDGILPSEQSKSLYADWYDDNGVLIQHLSLPIFQSIAVGEFLIPTKYSGNNLHVKAYTTWMLNFDTAFLFTKYFPVVQPNLNQEQFNTIKPIVNFFPEGGSIIHSVESYVAFKVTNQYGQPIKISGVIKNNLGEVIDTIITQHDGMGAVYIEKPNSKMQYTAYYKEEHSNFEYSKLLPAIEENGVSLLVQNVKNTVIATIHRSANVSSENKNIKLYVLINNQIAFKAFVKLTNKTSQIIHIPTNSLPTGIMQLTLFNEDYLPLAERIFFVKNVNFQFYPSVQSKINTNARAKNIIDIDVPDSLLTNLSISITDENVKQDSSTNIFSELLLSSDIKGKINNPAYYFSNSDETTQQHLDLVMLTNGWRKYNWQQIIKNQTPLIRYAKDSTYTQFIGKSFGLSKTDFLQDQKILLFLETKDSTKEHFILPIKKDGSFEISGILFFDTLKVYYSFLSNKKLNRNAEVSFQNDLFNTPSTNNIDTIIKKFTTINADYFEQQRKLDLEYERLLKTKNSGYLNEVVVKTKAKTAIDLLDEKYASGIFSGRDAYQFDLINDLRAQSSFSLFNYLQGIVPGLQVFRNGGETTLKWRQSTPSFFVDEMNTEADVVATIPMSEIAYVKVFRPPFFGGFGASSGGAIALYTRKGSDVKSSSGKGLEFKYLEGYSAYKYFFSPNYEKENDALTPDFRTTIYWNPYITTEGNQRKATIQFFNNDYSKKFKMVLCGMNSEGKLTWIEKMLN